jgi:transposase-like protein
MKLSTGFIHRLWDTPNITLRLARYLTAALPSLRLKRAAAAGSSLERKRGLGAVYAITASLLITSIPEATAKNYSIDHLKLYAHSRILDYKEFQCFNKIITKESRWNYTAKNGSHYGLGQMRSQHYRHLDPFRQIDATLKYITNRYETSCKAWSFHQVRNFY